MNKGKVREILAVAGIFIFLGVLAYGTSAAQVPRVTKEELKSMLDNPDLIILDVRTSKDWDDSKIRIQGAVREDPKKETKSWAKKYSKEKTIVLYCACPSEATSARVAQELISMGLKKVSALKGGWKEWSDAKYPVEAKWVIL